MIKKAIASLCLLPLLFVSACGASPEGSGKTQVRIGYFPNIIHPQALILKHEKTPEAFWGDRCNVSWTSFNAGPAEIEALFAGEIDIGYMGPGPAINANVKSGGDVKIISNATNAGAVFLIRTDSGIASVSDLSGKKVAVPQLGNTQHLCLLSLLREHGQKPTDQGGDVTIRASSNADIVNLMDNKSIDAAVVPEPWGSVMEENGGAKILLDYDELFLNGEYPSALVVASSDFIKQHPDLVSDFLSMHKDATDFINEEEEDAQTIVNEEIQTATGKALDAALIERAFTRIKATDALNKEAIMYFASLSKEEGFTGKVPEENDVFYDESGQ